MTGFPNAFAWRAACVADAVLATWARPWAVCFAIKSGSDATIFNFVEGQAGADPGTPAFILGAPEATWGRFLEPVPPRHHHGIFAMMYRLPEFSIQGDELVFMQTRTSRGGCSRWGSGWHWAGRCRYRCRCIQEKVSGRCRRSPAAMCR
jgi:hypothetical protein